MIFKTWRIKHIRRFCTAVSAGQGLRAADWLVNGRPSLEAPTCVTEEMMSIAEVPNTRGRTPNRHMRAATMSRLISSQWADMWPVHAIRWSIRLQCANLTEMINAVIYWCIKYEQNQIFVHISAPSLFFLRAFQSSFAWFAAQNNPSLPLTEPLYRPSNKPFQLSSGWWPLINNRRVRFAFFVGFVT